MHGGADAQWGTDAQSGKLYSRNTGTFDLKIYKFLLSQHGSNFGHYNYF